MIVIICLIRDMELRLCGLFDLGCGERGTTGQGIMGVLGLRVISAFC
jgi:hypothetical protein